MKNQVFITLLLLLFSIICKAVERPQITPNRLLEIYPKEWYQKKAKNWESYLSENSEDRAGWLEYFKVAQYAGFKQVQLSSLASKIQEKFEGTYEAHFVQFKVKGWNKEGIKQLELAFANNSNAKEILPEHIVLAETNFDRIKRKFLLMKLFENKAMYSSLLNYSYNVLNSINENAVLIVQGEPASIPIWVLQDLMQVKPNVKVLNLDLIENTEYLSKWLEKYNLNGITLLGSITSKDLLQKLPEINPNIDFFYGLTLPQNQISEIEEKLYVVGLASQYSQSSFAQYDVLKENIEEKFLLDYLTIDFNGEPKTSTGRVYETNYILPLFLLKEYYDNLGDTEKAKKWKNLILKLAERSQIKDRVTLLLEGKKENPTKDFKIIEFDVKELDKKFRKVKGNLYASAFELTNKEYWFYLDYLYKNNYKELYEKCRVDISKYDDFKQAMLQDYHYSPINFESIIRNTEIQKNGSFQTSTKTFQEHPAIDMTYESAKSYCEWLTTQYNQQENRKFKKVRFRLPTQKEWTMTALGYKNFTSWNLEENTIKVYNSLVSKKKKDIQTYNLAEHKALYPWANADFAIKDKVRNQLGCYLANVKAPETISCPSGQKGDNFSFIAPIAQYFPNNMGFYDVVGNVAEMIDEEGKAMGGSWNHTAEKCTITSVNLYNGSDTTVGFRLFMEVIEE